MKQRGLAVLCVAVMGITLAVGCGQTAEQRETTNETTTETTIEATTETATETITEATTETDLSDHTLMIYCGAGMAEPFQKIADQFQQETGCEMNVTYANAGQIQSQINTSKEGDFFIAGSVEELNPVKDYVDQKVDLVKHIPVLAVQKDNPKQILGLSDLTGEGVTVIIGDTEATPIGKIAKKAFTDAGIFDQVSIEATTTTAPQMATAIAAGEADAAIVWKENCKADGCEIVNTADLDSYVKTIPAASLNCSTDEKAVKAFYNYLDTDEANAVWSSYGYEMVP